MTQQFVLVISDCVAGREVEYNHYHDHRHIPDILAQQPECVSAQRFGSSAAITATPPCSS